MMIYLATESVRHVAFWTADHPQTHNYSHNYVTGQNRPICGRTLGPRPDFTTGVAWEGGTPREARHQRAIARRPICRDCTRELANALLELSVDEHDEDAIVRALRKVVDEPVAQAMFAAFSSSSLDDDVTILSSPL